MSRKYSNMRALFAITKGSLTAIFRNPSAFIFNLVFPLIFIVVFGFIAGGSFSIDVVLDKNSDKNNPIYTTLKEIKSVKIIEDKKEEDIVSDLSKGVIEGVLNIQKDANGTYIVDLKMTSASPSDGNVLKMMLSQLIDKANLSTVKIERPVAVLKEETVQGRRYSMIDFILPGQLGFSLLSAGVFGTAFIFLILRETLVIKRFFATPVSRFAIVCGEGLSRLIFSIFTAIILIVVGHYLFGFTLVNGFITFINMLVLCVISLIIFLGFGFVVSGIATNQNSVPAIANLITLPQFLLAGTFFPISNFPTWLQPVSNFLPLTYLNDALRKISFEGATIFDVGPEIGILCIWGVVVYAIAIKVFKWE